MGHLYLMIIDPSMQPIFLIQYGQYQYNSKFIITDGEKYARIIDTTWSHIKNCFAIYTSLTIPVVPSKQQIHKAIKESIENG